MRLTGKISSLLTGAALVATTGCVKLDLTNPNQATTDTFWQSQNDAVQAVNATYNALQNNGTYGRWVGFAFDIRSDIGFSPSPWADLSNFNKFTLVDYDFEVNREIWQHHYQAIFRANQVIANVPGIEMETGLRDRLVGEAKFVRALMYFNLVNLYGGNIPLITEPSEPSTRPASSTEADVYTRIYTDLTDAAAALPPSYSGADVGRATRGAALALLGKAHLQQRDWAAAATALQTVTTLGYDLIPNYAENFTSANENNRESVFEVQFGDRSLLASGVRGLNMAKMIGPCGPSFCDGRPTQWYFDQFQQERTTTGAVDPRLDATIFYNKPGGMDVYGQSFQARYGASSTDLYFKKYGEYYIAGDQDWDAAINYRVIRYADVLLMLAEALNEQGQTAAAKPLVDRVRARVNLAPLPGGLSQAAMRDRILHERLLEFGLEAQRFLDLKRQGLLTKALEAHDPEFSFFTAQKSERLPIPVSERNLNPGVQQNPGW
jgi:starch-binding outer membrane protein, SusD/RagB family